MELCKHSSLFIPFADLARRLRTLVQDDRRTAVAVVTMPEEMAINETVELYQHLRRLALPLTPPIVNAVLPQRFSSEEEALIRDGVTLPAEWEPYAAAARFELSRRRVAEGHIDRLRGAGVPTPVQLPYVFTHALTLSTIGPLRDALAAAAAQPGTTADSPR